MTYKIVDEYENQWETVGYANTIDMAKVMAEMRSEKMHGHCDVVIFVKGMDGRYYPYKEGGRHGRK